MKIISKQDIPLRGSPTPYVRIDKVGLYFIASCVRRLGLKADEHLVFLNDEKHWEFAKTADTKEFKLCKCSGTKGLWLLSTGLSKMMLKSMDVKLAQRLYIRETGRTMKDNQIIQLLPKEPL